VVTISVSMITGGPDFLKGNDGKSSGQAVRVQERVESLPGAVSLPGLDSSNPLEVREVLCQVLHCVLREVEAPMDLHGREPLVGETRHVELFEVRHRRRRQDLPDPIIGPTRTLPSPDVGHLEVPEVARLGEEV